MAEHPNPFRLESWFAGSPDPEVEAHVASCGACRAHVESLSAENAVFLAEQDPAEFVRQVRAAAEPEPAKAWPRWLALGLPALLAGAIALFIALPTTVPISPAPTGNPDTDRVRFKGSFGLAIYVLRDGEQSRHTGRVTLRTGDRLRFELTLEQRRTVSVGVRFGAEQQLLVDAEEHGPGRIFVGKGLKVSGKVEPGLLFAGDPARVAAVLRGDPATKDLGSVILEVTK